MTLRRRSLLLSGLSLITVFSGHPSYAVSDCVYSGVTFSDGAVSCQSGHQFRCSDGDWASLDLSCANPPAGPALENPSVCHCSEEETNACDQTGQGCCVSVVSGTCVKRCCPK